jgi:hypothetical protein
MPIPTQTVPKTAATIPPTIFAIALAALGLLFFIVADVSVARSEPIGSFVLVGAGNMGTDVMPVFKLPMGVILDSVVVFVPLPVPSVLVEEATTSVIPFAKSSITVNANNCVALDPEGVNGAGEAWLGSTQEMGASSCGHGVNTVPHIYWNSEPSVSLPITLGPQEVFWVVGKGKNGNNKPVVLAKNKNRRRCLAYIF